MTDITIILPLPSYSEAQDAAYVRTIESIKKLVDVTPTIIAVGDAASNNHLNEDRNRSLINIGLYSNHRSSGINNNNTNISIE